MSKPKTAKQIAATLKATKDASKKATLYHLLVTTCPSGTNILPLLKGAKQ